LWGITARFSRLRDQFPIQSRTIANASIAAAMATIQMRYCFSPGFLTCNHNEGSLQETGYRSSVNELSKA